MASRPPRKKRQTVVLNGIAVSPGYAIGRAHLVDRRRLKVPKYHVSTTRVRAEIERFDQALQVSEDQIRDIKSKLESAGEEHFLILDAHQLMLKDEMLVEGTHQLIQEQLINAEWALKKTIRSIKAIFENIEDEYFRERRSDVDFVGDRILRNLLGSTQPNLSLVDSNSIIVCHDLSPADTAFLLRTPVMGFATDVGGKTSHTAIMARSLELPAVVGLERVTELVGSGDTLIIDGSHGLVLVNPTDEEIRRYQALQMAYSTRRAQLDQTRDEPAVTRDGYRMGIAGNIELPDEAAIVLGYGAEGVGLFRTEYLYMNRETLPTEDEQFEAYRQVLELCGRAGATIRTLDLGGDKFITPLRISREINPVMGLRAIRFCLREQGIFRTQLRAMLRASLYGRLRIMFPLISDLTEVRQVKKIVAECRDQLVAEGHAVEDVPLGIMIELPSAAMIADLLAKEVAFFAIGTNDLIQYTLAIDRGNEHVAHLYRPLHPALLRMLDRIVKAAKGAGIPVSMCGEMAGEAFYAPVLVGLGLDELSMNSVSIPLVKSVIRVLDRDRCIELLDEIMLCDESDAVANVVAQRLTEMIDGAIPPEVFKPDPRQA